MSNKYRNVFFATVLCALGAAVAVPSYGAEAKDLAQAATEILAKAGDAEAMKAAAADAAKGASIEEAAVTVAAAAEVAGTEDAAAAYGAFLAAAAEQGAGAAEKLDAAKKAAATGALVSGAAFATKPAVDGALKDEILEAAAAPDAVLDGEKAWALKDLYKEVVAILRGGKYVMKEDGDEVKPTFAGEGFDYEDGLQSAGDESKVRTHAVGEDLKAVEPDLNGTGIFVGKISTPVEPAPVHKKHTKPSPTPVGLR